MAERPDLREIASSLREALGGLERDALVDVLTYVLNEYVVEGPPPLAPLQVERLEDLAGLSLAQLVSALQTRLDTPGLDLLRVEPGTDEVRVQTANGWVSLQPARGATAAASDRASPPAAGRTQPADTSGRAGARFVEQPMRPPTQPAASPGPTLPPAPTGRAAVDEAVARGRGDLAGGERGVVTAPAPRPRGLSVSGRPAGATQWNPPQAQPTPRPGSGGAAPRGAGSAETPPVDPSSSAAAPGQPGQPPQPGEKPAARDEDDATIRFSLLELD